MFLNNMFLQGSSTGTTVTLYIDKSTDTIHLSETDISDGDEVLSEISTDKISSS